MDNQTRGKSRRWQDGTLVIEEKYGIEIHMEMLPLLQLDQLIT
jgi:hypothetical protein